MLQSWLCYYDWITSGDGPPPPGEDILNDDDELDDYVERWKESLKNPDKKKTNSFKVG